MLYVNFIFVECSWFREYIAFMNCLPHLSIERQRVCETHSASHHTKYHVFLLRPNAKIEIHCVVHFFKIIIIVVGFYGFFLLLLSSALLLLLRYGYFTSTHNHLFTKWKHIFQCYLLVLLKCHQKRDFFCGLLLTFDGWFLVCDPFKCHKSRHINLSFFVAQNRMVHFNIVFEKWGKHSKRRTITTDLE